MKREGGQIDQARVCVVAVGERRIYAMNLMIVAGIYGADFVAVHTNAAKLVKSLAPTQIFTGHGENHEDRQIHKISLGSLARQQLCNALIGAEMVILLTGLETGECVGVVHAIAEMVSALNIMTVAVVTRPFPLPLQPMTHLRLTDMQQWVDLLLVITEQTTCQQQADLDAVKTIRALNNLVYASGLINLDLADLKSIAGGRGAAILTTGEAQGMQYARRAARQALYAHSQGRGIHGAQRLLLHLTVGQGANLADVQEATQVFQEVAHPEANIILGVTIDVNFINRLWVTAVAAGFPTTVPKQETAPYLSATPGAGATWRTFTTRLRQKLPSQGREICRLAVRLVHQAPAGGANLPIDTSR